MKVGFITCNKLSTFFPSNKNPLFTHDDQVLADYLESKSIKVEPVIWGCSIDEIKKNKLDLLIIRSPWDYMDSEENRFGFIEWLKCLENEKINVENPLSLVLWNLNKTYLKELEHLNIPIPTTRIISPNEKINLNEIFNTLGPFVIKPCISAGATDTYKVLNTAQISELTKGEAGYPVFDKLRDNRQFIIQPYLNEIENTGEWSLIFINEEFQHAVLKKPAPGNWFVQDEKGGTVETLTPPREVLDLGNKTTNLIRLAFYQKTKIKLENPILYIRVDIIPARNQYFIGEVEMTEPELFFKNRSSNDQKLMEKSLDKFYQSILKYQSLT